MVELRPGWQGPYEVPPHRVEAALLEAARRCPGVLAEPAPTTWVSRVADRGIDYTLVCYIEDFPARPVTGEARSATVRALTPCECLVVSADALRPLLEESPDLVRRLSEVLGARQAELGTAQVAPDEADRTERSGQLLQRIRSLFSLRPATSQPPLSRRG